MSSEADGLYHFISKSSRPRIDKKDIARTNYSVFLQQLAIQLTCPKHVYIVREMLLKENYAHDE